MAAVLSGNIDIGFAGPEASIYVYNEGKEDYTQVFAQMTQRDGSFLVGRKKDASFSWDKIRGKTILPGRKAACPIWRSNTSSAKTAWIRIRTSP